MPSKLPKSVTKIPVPIYGGTIWFAQSVEDAQICASLLGAEFSPDGWGGLCYPGISYKSDRIILVVTRDGGPDILVHELAHATFNILGHAGVLVSSRDDEAFCYLLQHLFVQAVKHLKA